MNINLQIAKLVETNYHGDYYECTFEINGSNYIYNIPFNMYDHFFDRIKDSSSFYVVIKDNTVISLTNLTNSYTVYNDSVTNLNYIKDNIKELLKNKGFYIVDSNIVNRIKFNDGIVYYINVNGLIYLIPALYGTPLMHTLNEINDSNITVVMTDISPIAILSNNYVFDTIKDSYEDSKLIRNGNIDKTKKFYNSSDDDIDIYIYNAIYKKDEDIKNNNRHI